MRWGSFKIASMFLTYRRPHLRNQCLLFRAPVYPASTTSQGSRHGWSPLWTLTCLIITNIRQYHFTTHGANILTRVKIFFTALSQKSALLQLHCGWLCGLAGGWEWGRHLPISALTPGSPVLAPADREHQELSSFHHRHPWHPDTRHPDILTQVPEGPETAGMM